MRGFLLLLLLLGSVPAAAAPRKQKAGPAPEPVEFTVEIPRSELGLSADSPVSPPAHQNSAELSFSAWTPRSFTRGSYHGTTSRLERTKVPLLSLNGGFPLGRIGYGVEARARAGLGFARLTRSGPALTPNAVGEARQTLNFFLMRAGAELRGPGLFRGTVEPFAAGSVLPVALLGPASPYEGAVSASGLGLEAEGGFRVFPGFLTGFLGGGQGSLSLGAHYTAGELGGSSLRGLGAFAALGAAL